MRQSTAVTWLSALAIVLTACDDGSVEPSGETEPPNATSRTATASPTDAPAGGSPSPAPSPTSEVAMAPDRALAVQRGGLVEVVIPTGDVVGEVDADLGEGAGSVVYSPARQSVLFSRTVTGALQEIVEVNLGDDRTQSVVGTGHAVAVAPDGQRVAVAHRELGEDEPDREVLEVRTFDGEVLARWDDRVAAEEPVRTSHLTWSPDGTRLAFQLQFEDGTEVRTLDPATDGGSLQQDTQEVAPSGDLRLLTAPEFRPATGRLAVVDGPGLDPDAEQVWRVSTLDPDTGAVSDVLVESDRPVAELDFDPTGEHLLYLTGHAHPPREDEAAEPPILFHWHDGTSTEVARDLTDVAW